MKRIILALAVILAVGSVNLAARDIPTRVTGYSSVITVVSGTTPLEITGIKLTSLAGAASACGTLVDGSNTVTGRVIDDVCFVGNTPNAYFAYNANVYSGSLLLNFSGQAVTVSATVFRKQAPNVLQ